MLFSASFPQWQRDDAGTVMNLGTSLDGWMSEFVLKGLECLWRGELSFMNKNSNFIPPDLKKITKSNN